MSQYSPFPPNGSNYGGTPNYYSRPTRPTAVSGVAITGIILGSLGLICSGGGALLNWNAMVNGGINPLAPQLPPMDHNILAYSVFQCFFNVGLALWLLIGCIGALSLKPFARKSLMIWAGLSIVWWIVVALVQLTWMGPEIQKTTESITGGGSAYNAGRHAGMVIGAMLFSGVMCIIPVLILVLWNRPHVQAAFGENGMPPQQYPPNYPPQYPR